jgi:hypothetical protein
MKFFQALEMTYHAIFIEEPSLPPWFMAQVNLQEVMKLIPKHIEYEEKKELYSTYIKYYNMSMEDKFNFHMRAKTNQLMRMKTEVLTIWIVDENGICMIHPESM